MHCTEQFAPCSDTGGQKHLVVTTPNTKLFVRDIHRAVLGYGPAMGQGPVGQKGTTVGPGTARKYIKTRESTLHAFPQSMGSLVSKHKPTHGQSTPSRKAVARSCFPPKASAANTHAGTHPKEKGHTCSLNRTSSRKASINFSCLVSLEET